MQKKFWIKLFVLLIRKYSPVDQCSGQCSRAALRKLIFYFFSNWMRYDRGDSFPFDFEPNGNPFGSKTKGKLSPRSYPIQCERKWKCSFLSVAWANAYMYQSPLMKMTGRIEIFPGSSFWGRAEIWSNFFFGWGGSRLTWSYIDSAKFLRVIISVTEVDCSVCWRLR